MNDSFIGNELSSILKEMNIIFFESLKPEYRESDNFKLLEIQTVIDQLLEIELIDRISTLKSYAESDDLHEKAYVLNFFGHDVKLPEEILSYESIWDIPEKYFEHLNDVSVYEYVDWLKLDNPLNYINIIAGSVFSDVEISYVGEIKKYFNDNVDLYHIICFKLVGLSLAPIKNNMNLPITTDMLDFIVRLVKKSVLFLEEFHYPEGLEKFDLTHIKPKFDKFKHLDKARKKKNIGPKLLKIKAWELFESGKYGTVKAKAVFLMFDELGAYAKNNSIDFWPEKYNEFFYNKTLCRTKPKK